MGSSARAISHQNLETASTFRSETITGSHLFKICGYSLTKGIGIGKSITSDAFTVGGYNWIIQVYPDGAAESRKDFISIRVGPRGNDTEVKALITFTILQQNGASSNFSATSPVWTFTDPKIRFWGSWEFAKRTEFEASKHLKDDSFTVKCTITVIKGTKVEVTHPYGVIVPPSNLNQNLANLFESGKGADVTFVVKGEILKAHRCVLAVRSAVFNAELFGCMKEKWADTITVEDIETSVFKSMLYFIYSDSLPDFEVTTDVDSEKQDMRLMSQHLLVAADRYQLERLRLMCEDLLCKNLSVSNVGTALILAEQHNCSQLKAECLRFMSSPEVFKAVAQTDEFHNLIRVCPILKDL
ncbi:BTB/POZ and MATH domain-containing protein 1-like isoform X1 [Carex littledalei]|uniref:BTB/POZ and MATH domain-containing protein 1-like isoform X1 n=1 Tax=Carex littledalei TaxID=544730 RepID=A0A833R049_9POAL|nr:BTB/POZ and MATH domain-containing protein 1-like isoform X1 [Carex littledalei]